MVTTLILSEQSFGAVFALWFSEMYVCLKKYKNSFELSIRPLNLKKCFNNHDPGMFWASLDSHCEHPYIKGYEGFLFEATYVLPLS